MFYVDPLFLTILGVGVVILLLNVLLLFWFLGMRRKLNLLFKGKKIKNLEDVLTGQLQKTRKIEVEMLDLFKRAEKLENISEQTFQKIGIIRFNPFSDMGGNQSFAVALLDSQDNGFVLSSLFIKEGNRVYAKAIKNGQSDYPLSKEEKEALDIAISYKK